MNKTNECGCGSCSICYDFEMTPLLEARAAIQRVRELHKPIQLDKDWGEHCEYCDQDYPCGTIKALGGEQG